MALVAIGLNHRTVPLDVLERTTVEPHRLPKALHDLASRPHLSEVVVLSTCNRTEIYAYAERYHGAVEDVAHFLADRSGLPVERFVDPVYTPEAPGAAVYGHYDAGAASHLFRVASGLDSAVVGEHEILGQLKRAWEAAQREGVAGPHLNAAFRHALEVGKRARTETGIGRHTASISAAAVALAAEHLGGLDGRRVLVLGAGEMGGGIAAAIASLDAASVLVANRTWERALALAGRVGGTAVPLSELRGALADVDLVLTTTGASSIMVEHADLEPVVEARAGRPLLIVDVAVPRDVDPSVADLAGVTLFDMDDLRAFAERGIARRADEVLRVEEIVEEEVLRYVDEATARQVAPLVATLRAGAERIRREEVAGFESRLAGLEPHERETVEALTRRIVATLLHEPSVRVKEASGTARGERLAEALRDLFDL